MKPTLLAALFALGASLSLVRADSVQEFTFALPDLEGHISLGVFDSANKLVRTLFVSATEKNFTIGLDGLGTEWDGKDDLGQPLPSGKYFVRGYVIGQKIKSEGVAYHFNDWVDDDTSPAVIAPRVIWAQNGEIILEGASLLCHYAGTDGLKKIGEFAPGSQFLGASVTAAFYQTPPSGLSVFYYLDASRNSSLSIDHLSFSRAAIWRNQIYLAPAANASEQRLTVGHLTPVPAVVGAIDSPTKIRFLDANDSALIASDGQAVWIFRGEKFACIPLAEQIPISALSAGTDETFWVAGPAFVRQYSFSGEILRQLDGSFSDIFADKDREQIFLTATSTNGAVTTKALRPTADVGPASTTSSRPVNWEVFLEKTATPCKNFGLAGGQVVADAGNTPQNSRCRVNLAAGDAPGDHSALEMKVTAANGEIWLATADGLRLLLIGKLSGAERCVIAAQGSSATVFAGNGAVVAEYALTNLEQFGKIDAGEIDLP